MNTEQLLRHPCTVCAQQTTMWCSRCQNAWYCTPEHLQGVSIRRMLRLRCSNMYQIALQDWPRHRKECIPVNAVAQGNVTATPPPAQQQLITVTAILFAPEEGAYMS